MKAYNEHAFARMDTTSALLASLPQTFTAKEFNAIREKQARKSSGMVRLPVRYIPHVHMSYSLNGLREIGAIVVAFTEPVKIKVSTPIYEVIVRSTGESLLTGTKEKCQEFLGQSWRHMGMRFKDYEDCEITVQRYYYSVNYEAYRAYIHKTFGAI